MVLRMEILRVRYQVRGCGSEGIEGEGTEVDGEGKCNWQCMGSLGEKGKMDGLSFYP